MSKNKERGLYLGCQRLDVGRDLGQAQRVGVAHDGHHQAVGRLHRDGDVDVVVLADEVVEPAGVHIGHLAQRLQEQY